MSENQEFGPRDAFIILRFLDEEGELIDSFVGFSIPIPNEGDAVTLSEYELSIGDDNEEVEERDINRSDAYLVDDIAYDFVNVNTDHEDIGIDSPMVVVGITINEAN